VPEIRPPVKRDAGGIARTEALAFNFEARPEDLDLEGKLCAYDGNDVVAVATAIDFDQWFGGRPLQCAGVAGVAVLPEHRGRGLARQLVTQLLRRERDRGRHLSALYPANAALYRHLGYEFGGLQPRFLAPLTDVPASKPAPGAPWPREMRETDIEAVMACHRRYVSAHPGPVHSRSAAYWRNHVLAHRGEGVNQRTVVVPGDEGIAGYASYYSEHRGGSGYRVNCKHLVATTPGALAALLGYFRRFERSAFELAWWGPPTVGPFGAALATGGLDLGCEARRWMTRLLDVPGALAGRGYPPGDLELVVAVVDPVFPGNCGPWLVRVSGGRARVVPVPAGCRAPGHSGPTVPIGAFSALFTGMASPADLIALGVLDDDGAYAAALTAVFAGPTPWMPDFF
jgi:predicted acetyltransferase